MARAGTTTLPDWAVAAVGGDPGPDQWADAPAEE